MSELKDLRVSFLYSIKMQEWVRSFRVYIADG